jgi:hypothetical protein
MCGGLVPQAAAASCITIALLVAAEPPAAAGPRPGPGCWVYRAQGTRAHVRHEGPCGGALCLCFVKHAP